MAEIDIDTDKLKVISNEFYGVSNRVSGIVNEVNDIINSLSQSSVWVGPNAEQFIRLTLPEQKVMQSFCYSLSAYASYLDGVCSKYDGMYNKYRRDNENTH